jgi:hypothetical protein
LSFEHPAGVKRLADGSEVIKCPHCGAEFETLPHGGTPDQGVDPKGVV